MSRLLVQRRARLPDATRVARAQRAPELGPRILFFSGGTALKKLSRMLKTYTHNSVHVLTPFDSGGSSARLREHFRMLSVGDLRNRIIALADETQRGNPAVYELFAHRFAADVSQASLVTRLDALIAGRDPLVTDVPEPLRFTARTHLADFREAAPAHFDLRGASVGNLMLVGGYLANDRQIDPVLLMLSKLVEARGEVRPVVADDLHLKATLDDGTELVGQHRITGNGEPPPSARIRDLSLVRALDDDTPATVATSAHVLSLIAAADLICFPMGSFYTSVLANLLPEGIGRAIAAADCPKVFVPNADADPEMRGMSVADAIEALLRFVRKDAGDVGVERILDGVLLDVADESYAYAVERERIVEQGVTVARLPLVQTRDRQHAPRRLAEALLSLA